MAPTFEKMWTQGRATWREGPDAVPMTMTPAEFTRHLEQDIVKWERVVKVSGAKADR